MAADIAMKRTKRLASSEKRNVMGGQLWFEEVNWSSPPINWKSNAAVLADNCATQPVRQPKQYDVLVTDNLFGDILSDVAAMLTGSLGMLPSASLGAPDAETGRARALYEPAHGSAPVLPVRARPIRSPRS